MNSIDIVNDYVQRFWDEGQATTSVIYNVTCPSIAICSISLSLQYQGLKRNTAREKREKQFLIELSNNHYQ